MIRNALVTLALLCVAGSASAQATLNTSDIDAVLGRPGAWIQGVYVVGFPRPDLNVRLDGVRITTAHVLSFLTFVGTDDQADVMGELCLLPGEMTPAVAGLRAGGLEVTAIHNHFLGETPRLMFAHFMAHGPAVKIASAFKSALGVTTTPLGKPAAVARGSAPAWSLAVRNAMERPGEYLASDRTLEIDIMSADFKPGPDDFWFESLLYFQEALGGRVATTGDLMVTARELNPVLTSLTNHHFKIEGVHNHMTEEQPRVFFVHFWRIGTPEELADGLNATLLLMNTRR